MKININTHEYYTETEIIINCNRMSEHIEKLLASIRMLDMKMIAYKEGRQSVIEIAEIIYIESIEKRTFLYTLTDFYECHFWLHELEEKLIDKNFMRASRNCLVNINHIRFIEADMNSRLVLTMPKDIKLVVSRQYAFAIKKKLEAYHG